MNALLPVSWIYGGAVWIRNRAFDRGCLRTTSAGVPVVSVGNITVGGTGKTPLVEYIARYFTARGRRVGIISRGYGRSSRGTVTVADGRSLLADALRGGDEPVEVAMRLPNVVVVVSERRIDAARVAVDRWKADVLILDDGFQHRYLRRDLDIVVLKRPSETFSDLLLPAGRKRETNRSLSRADLLAFSGVESADPALQSAGEYCNGPVFGYQYVIERLELVGGRDHLLPSAVRGKTVAAFSGIGDPDSFEADLTGIGLIVRHHTRFKDHHRVSDAELAGVFRGASMRNDEMIVTTEKDMARLSAAQRANAARQSGIPLYSVRLSVTVTFGGDEFHRLLAGVLAGFPEGAPV